MDYKIIFSGPAIDDLENIVRFIARDNPEAAARFGGKLIGSVRHLSNFRVLAVSSPNKMTSMSGKSFSSRIGFSTG